MAVWKKPGLGQKKCLKLDELSEKLVNGGGITHIETTPHYVECWVTVHVQR